MLRGWQGGGGPRKMGSFNTIRALSSELQRGTQSRERLVNKQEGAQTLSRQCRTPNKNLDVNISRMSRRCFECEPSQRGCLASDGGMLRGEVQILRNAVQTAEHHHPAGHRHNASPPRTPLIRAKASARASRSRLQTLCKPFSGRRHASDHNSN
ncbi:hypothetical protein EYF80_047654 [Liparis tanakae]|uniref:Uncharacterized protein n=1 Tax=Liparis tanakae TaxID=230148 RepID=A0A4Z2FPE1_9TELE|nr:hypothetical protein EYF80_047654 [Liparis tanakae]